MRFPFASPSRAHGYGHTGISRGWQVYSAQGESVSRWAEGLRVHAPVEVHTRPTVALGADDVATRCLQWNTMRQRKLSWLASAREILETQQCTFKPDSQGLAYLQAVKGDFASPLELPWSCTSAGEPYS